MADDEFEDLWDEDARWDSMKKLKEEIERLRSLLLEARDAPWDAHRTYGHWLLDVDRALRGEGE